MTRSLGTQLSWYLALVAVATEFTVSGNLLTFFGSPYISEGGLFFQKVHPGSYLAILSGIISTIGRAGRLGRYRVSWPIAGFLAGITLCSIYAIATSGTGDVVVFIDTFLPAGMLALALRDLHEPRRWRLRRITQCLLIFNAGLALCELASQTHLIPLPVKGMADKVEFRPTALYDHALTGAAVTMLGLWLMPVARGPGRWCYQFLLVAAMVAFGERAPLAAAMLSGIVYVLNCYGTRVFARNLYARNVAVLVFLMAATVGLSLAILSSGSTADIRLGSHLYWDDSAQVRFSQFDILDMLATRELLFGCPRADLLALIEPMRLSTHVAVIENFWLFTFIALGLFGFTIFVASFLSLICWLWHTSGTKGHYMIVLFLVVASASNSLGRKSTLLVTLIPCVIASATHVARNRAPTGTLVVQA